MLRPPSMTAPSGRTSVAPHTFGVPPPPQSSPVGQVVPPSGPQATIPPHPSATTPQFIAPEQAATGMHAATPPHTLGVPPPPQVAGAVQEPQVYVLPHPSPTSPQLSAMMPPSARTAEHAVAGAIGAQALRPPSMMPPSGRM